MDPGYDAGHLQTLRQDLERLNEAARDQGLVAGRAGRAARRTRAGAPKRPERKAAVTTTKTVAAKARATAKPAGKGAKTKTVDAKAAKPSKAKSSTAKSSKAESSKTTTKARKGKAAPVAKRGGVELADRGKTGARRLLAMLERTADDQSPQIPGTAFTEGGVVRLLAHLRRRRSQRFRFLRRLYTFLTRPLPMGMRTSAGIGVERLQVVSGQLHEIETNGWHHFRARRAARRAKRASVAQAQAGAPAETTPKTPAKRAKRTKTVEATAEATS